MIHLNRRDLLEQAGKTGLGLAAGAAVHSMAAPARSADSAEKLTLAVVGIRGRGRQLASDFASRNDCQVAYLCDVDESLFPERVAEIEQIQGSAPTTVQDFRRALDDPSIDAIVCATPDHWHALATVWACQAGKDVYVEKPVSHTPWEGRKMVEAARHYERIVQVGTQNRSAPYNHAAKAYLDEGHLGAIHMVRVYNQKFQPNAQSVPDGKVPGHLDWDMWTGPAQESEFNTNYQDRWNSFWRFSGGDIINDAVHQLDLARWLAGVDYPKSVYSTGGRFDEKGVFETPDTQVAVYEFNNLVMILELTLYTPYMIKSDAALRNSDLHPHWPQNATRIEIYGTQGYMVVGRMGGGWQVFHRPRSRQPVVAAQEYGRFPDPEHKQNFVDSVRSRQTPNADIEQGHRSTLLCQYANISYRLGGRKLVVNPDNESFVSDEEACSLLKRDYRSPWVVPDRV